MKKRINKKGFTLIELMVVVGVLGVLMAIAIPAYNGIEARAYQTVCETNERNYVTAWSMYRIVHNNVIDTTTAAVTDPETLFKEDTTNGVQYFDANKFPQCPAGGTYAVAISTATNVPTATFTCDVHDSSSSSQ